MKLANKAMTIHPNQNAIKSPATTSPNVAVTSRQTTKSPKNLGSTKRRGKAFRPRARSLKSKASMKLIQSAAPFRHQLKRDSQAPRKSGSMVSDFKNLTR